MYKYRIIVFFIASFLTACASHDPLKVVARYNKYKDPLQAVLDIRKKIDENPDDLFFQTIKYEYEMKAANYYYEKGQKLYYQGEYQAAINEFNKGLVADKNYEKLQQAIRFATQQKEADELYFEAVKTYQVGKLKESVSILKSVLNVVPTHNAAKTLLDKVQKDIKNNGNILDALGDSRKITLNFRNTNIKTAFAFLSKSFNINIIFDESVKAQSITLYAKDVTFRQALNLMLATSKMFYQRMSRNTVLVAPDTKSMREQYEEYIIRTFQLRTISAKQMSEIIKGVLKVNKLVVNEDMNTIMVRDNESILNLIGKLIDINDRRPAEVLLEVEILEVNRNKAENLGLSYDSAIGITLPDADPAVNNFNTAINSGVISMPSITFNYLKKDTDAKTLANPKIRVINQKPAKIHIGDRIPLRSATIQNAAGGTQTSYEYSEIGIRLDVNPIIHYDNSVTVDLNLEVSSLGGNLGSDEEPIYSVGTRNTQTHMLLKDGETAVIGGLIRDEDRNNTVKLPGLGSIPIIGALFKNSEGTLGRTDVLLTITPRIVRGWDIPRKSLQEIYSGTAEHFSSEPIFPEETNTVAISDMKSSSDVVQRNTKDASIRSDPALSDRAETALLNFDKPLYVTKSGEEFSINIATQNLSEVKKLILPISYNNDVVQIKGVNAISSSIADVQKKYTENGIVLDITFKDDSSSIKDQSILTLIMAGNKNGISYLVGKQSTAVSKNGNTIPLESHASRIVVK